jgi:tetratricopeptide (TPR) repeat protein
MTAATLARREGLPYSAASALLGAADAALDAAVPGPERLVQIDAWVAEAAESAERLGFERVRAHVYRLRGRLLRAQRDYRGAVADFIEALRRFIALEDRLGVARTDLAFGDLLVNVPGAGDPRRGRFLLEEARGIFERAGATNPRFTMPALLA